ASLTHINYSLSLHDALPISKNVYNKHSPEEWKRHALSLAANCSTRAARRSVASSSSSTSQAKPVKARLEGSNCELATERLAAREIGRAPSELQSRFDLVCRL